MFHKYKYAAFMLLSIGINVEKQNYRAYCKVSAMWRSGRLYVCDAEKHLQKFRIYEDFFVIYC